AEDGIRDLIVTGVQTCALPIYVRGRAVRDRAGRGRGTAAARARRRHPRPVRAALDPHARRRVDRHPWRTLGRAGGGQRGRRGPRSEERRVGKEWRGWWWRTG